MNDCATLSDYFVDFMTTDSLFQKMVSYGAPWTLEIGAQMDMAYFSMYSGIKTPTLFVKQNKNSSGINSTAIAQLLLAVYGINWKHLWDSFNVEYNPIEPYSIKETVYREHQTYEKLGSTDTLDSSVSSSLHSSSEEHRDDNTKNNSNETIGVTTTGKTEVEHGEVIDKEGESDSYNYGFNSPEKVPTNVISEIGKDTHSGTDTTIQTGSTNTTDEVESSSLLNSWVNSSADSNSNDKRTEMSESNATDNTTGSENITRTRLGNIGVKTYQELIKQDRELWLWNFFHIVFQDVDEYLVLSVYNC